MNLPGFAHEPRNSANKDWYTPLWIFDELGLQFDLDPCQPPGGIAWIPANKYFTIEDDGLTQPWLGRVWLNPPYGEATKFWLARMDRHRNGVALMFSRTDCKWFHDYVIKADAILFLRGRIRFVDGLDKTSKSGSGCGSILVAWGEENVAALAAMQQHGFLVKL